MSVGDEGDRSSFVFDHNIVAVTNGSLFDAASNRSFANETFVNNTYFVYNPLGNAPAGFPCDPHHPFAGRFWLESGEAITVDQPLYSSNKAYKATLSAAGPFTILRADNSPVWSTNATLPTPSVGMQADQQVSLAQYKGLALGCLTHRLVGRQLLRP